MIIYSSSDDDSSSSSSSSSETHRKLKHRGGAARKQRDSSSSSEEEVVRKSHKHQHKKSSVRKHSHAAKIKAKMLQANVKKAPKSMSPASRHKHHLKVKLAKKVKQLEEHDRHSLVRRPSPTVVRRDILKKDRTPEHRIASPTTRIRVSVPNNRVIQDRASRGGPLKDSPAIVGRRHVRETIDERERNELLRQKEREKMRRMQEEEHYARAKGNPDRSTRLLPPSRMTPDKHHHDRSRSHSHGRVPIRERLDKDYDRPEYRRSISRENEDYGIMRGNQRDPQQIDNNRSYDYRSDDRRISNHEFGQSSTPSSRMYDDRHHRMPNWEENRMNDPDARGSNNRMYDGNNRNWDGPSSSMPHDRKRIPDDAPYNKERQWNDGSVQHDKWNKDKDQPEWKQRGPSWKDQGSNVPQQSTPTMPHPRRWPGPNLSDSWNQRGSAPSLSSHQQQSHKMDPHLSSSSSGGPPFKPRSSPYFGFKRFPYKRFPNQYSKINFPSKRVLPSASSVSNHESAHSNKQDDNLDSAVKSSSSSSNEQTQSQPLQQQQQSDNLGNESGEITTEAEEDKIAQPDTTFSGNADAQYTEECEGNLSEFSDIDDEILNREEVSKCFTK